MVNALSTFNIYIYYISRDYCDVFSLCKKQSYGGAIYIKKTCKHINKNVKF